MVNSTVRRENNFPTGKLLALSIIGILIFAALISLPLLDAKDAEAKKKSTNKNKKTKVKTKVPTSSQGGISINGCSDTKGTNGGIAIFGCAKGGTGPNGGKGGIAIFGTANGGNPGTDGVNGVQGQNGVCYRHEPWYRRHWRNGPWR